MSPHPSFHLTLMMTSAQVVETSVTVTDNSPFQDYPHPDDHTTRSTVTPGFKPFTVLKSTIANISYLELFNLSIVNLSFAIKPETQRLEEYIRALVCQAKRSNIPFIQFNFYINSIQSEFIQFNPYLFNLIFTFVQFNFYIHSIQAGFIQFNFYIYSIQFLY